LHSLRSISPTSVGHLVALALMESGWLTALGFVVYAMIVPDRSDWPFSTFAVAALWLLAALPVLFSGQSTRQGAAVALPFVGLGLYLVMVVADGGDFSLPSMRASDAFYKLIIMVAMAIILWLRGVAAGAAASDGNDFLADDLYHRFRLGVLVLTAIALFNAAIIGNVPIGILLKSQLGSIVVSFLFFALLNLAWNNLEEAQANISRFGGSARPQLGIWLVSLLLIVGLMVPLTALLGGWNGNALDPLSGFFTLLAIGLGAVGGLVGGFVNFLIGGLLVQKPPTITPPTPIAAPTAGANLPASPPPPFTDTVLTPLEPITKVNDSPIPMIVAITVLLIVVFILLRQVEQRTTQRRLALGAETGRENFGSWSLFFNQLNQWLQGLWASLLLRLGLRQPLVGEDELAALAHDEQQRSMVSLRQSYRTFLRLAAQGGSPRPQQTTPTEFLTLLQARYHDCLPSRAAASLTASYVAARYGGLRPTQAQVIAAQGALRELEAFFREEAKRQSRDGPQPSRPQAA